MMNARIAGIPCQINVINYEPATRGGPDEPPSGPEIEYVVYDLRGRKAGWLMAKITDEDDQAILEQHEANLQESREETRIDAYIASLEDRAWA
ncbi:hypothetical protein [Vreelandella alkaliphila]|uniref:hypothetical protein n=1 Tax=Vreelandella alkaliphila TaxID=272774 RepID=UPI003FD7D6E7